MTSRSIPVNSLLVCLAWTLAVVLQAVDMAFGPDVGRVGMLLALAAVAVQFCGKIDEMERRERAAYELGRESVRSIR